MNETSKHANARTRSRYSRAQRCTSRLVLAIFLLGSAPAGAYETEALGEANTVAGSGHFTADTTDRTEYTQTSQRTILEWGQDIHQPAGHSLEFRQAQNYVILNRSPGIRSSEFWGTVQCDATCIFANSAGVSFQDGSFVDVGQMIVAAGNISNESFMNTALGPDGFMSGELNFTDVMGRVENFGTMQGGAITLIGQSVANFGHVETTDGSFMMLAGNEVILRDHDSPIVIQSQLAPAPAPGESAAPAIENAGTVDARGGRVRMAAGDMLSFAIRQSGEIKAARIELEGGDGGLVEVAGTLDASNLDDTQGVGGAIDVLGEYVMIGEEAVLDASGNAGGGKIRIGGDQGGKGDVRTATGTYVHRDAVIRADAVEDGDGGEIIVWGDDLAQIYGSLSARGGLFGGSGGFAETSSGHWLDVSRAPDLTARSGLPGDRGGLWLIDPTDIYIVSEAAACAANPACLDPALTEENLNNPLFFDNAGNLITPNVRPTLDDSLITNTILAQALAGGSDVWISTATVSEITGSQDGNITVDAAVEIDDADVNRPTEATLVLFAANDIIINEAIRVIRNPNGSPTTKTNMTLNLRFLAGDNFTQFQNTVDAGELPNQYIGELAINAAISTGGGFVDFDAIDITSTAAGTILTGGGVIALTADGGDATLLGVIDSSTQILDNQGDRLVGGNVTVSSFARRHPVDTAESQPSEITGGDVLLATDVLTGGGNFTGTARGGNLDIDNKIETRGGGVFLHSERLSFNPVTDADEGSVLSQGGRITISETARIESGGSVVSVGAGQDPLSGDLGAEEIVFRGVIDSRARDEDGVLDIDQRGGQVQFRTQGENARVVMLGDRAADAPDGMGSCDNTGPCIVTDGNDFFSEGDGSFFLQNARIDTRAYGAAEEDPGASVVDIRHRGAVDIIEDAGRETLLVGTDLVLIEAGSTSGSENEIGSGVGDLTFAGDADVVGDIIRLRAGNGYTPDDPDAQSARIVFGDVNLLGATGVGTPTTLSVEQDADLLADDVFASLGSDLSGLERYTLSAFDGILTINDASTIAPPAPGAPAVSAYDLVLRAGTDVVVNDDFEANSIDDLSIRIEDSYVLTSALANRITGAASGLTISAGQSTDETTPSLLLRTSGVGDQDFTLEASNELLLHSGLGSGANGDLEIESGVTLRAPNITLWAGNGDGEGDAAVVAKAAGPATGPFFDTTAAATSTSFMIRQDATIEDASVIGPDQFTQSTTGLDYRLRSDVGGIELADAAAAALVNTRLSLHSQGEITLQDVLTLQSMDIGRLGSFVYNRAINDKINIVDGPESRLVIRAGIATAGNLSFAMELEAREIVARDIRLVAGDGPGGVAADSIIDLAPPRGFADPLFRAPTGQTLDFVFRQDGAVVQSALPSLAGNFNGQAPRTYAIRSDDRSIVLDDFSGFEDRLPMATERLILSGPIVNLVRSDGSDLNFDADFGLTTSPATVPMEIRAVNVDLQAFVLEGQSAAKVLPGQNVVITNFDLDESETTQPGLPPSLMDLSERPVEDAPARLLITQDGTIALVDLIDLAQIGDGTATLPDYLLASRWGSVHVDPDHVAPSYDPNLDDGIEARVDNLFLFVEDATHGDATRSIFLHEDGAGSATYTLRTLIAQTPFAWNVENADNPLAALQIDAADFIELRAGLGNTGDLTFANGDASRPVVLHSDQIDLWAGDDPFDPLEGNVESTDRPVVRASSGVRFDFDASPDTPTDLRISQHGSFVDANPGVGESLIPVAASFLDDIPDAMNLTSFLGDIVIENFVVNAGTGEQALAAKNITLVAGGALPNPPEDEPGTGGLIRLADLDGDDLDLTDPNYESVFLFSRNIELETNGTGVIKAESDLVLLFGPQEGFLSPNAVSFIQETAFAENPNDCDAGCLPSALQLGQGAVGVDYTIQSTASSILLDETLAPKVWFSDLTLLADNTSGGDDVVISVGSNIFLDLAFESLTVGASAYDPAVPFDILLQASGTPDPDTGAPIMQIGAADRLTFNGDVRIDGDIELTGQTVEFKNTLDGTTAGQDKIEVIATGEARFDSSVGTNTILDVLRVTFLGTAPTGTPSARFGAADQGTLTTVTANEIAFAYLRDATSGTPTMRLPSTSTIYKQDGDLLFRATETFDMARGEKLSVQGDLTIEVGTRAVLGDVSALNIQVTGLTPTGPKPVIEIQRRPAAPYRTRNGRFELDAGIDYVANNIDFDGDIVLSGLGANPIFAVANPSNAPSWMNAFSVLDIQPSGLPITAAYFDWAFGTPLRDLHPEGPSRDDISSIYFPEDIVPSPNPWLRDNFIPYNEATLADLDVDARPTTPREFAGRMAGAAIIDDVGTNLGAWDHQLLAVADARLRGREAERAVAFYEQLFGPGGSRTAYLRATLQNALDQYVRTTGARRVVGFELRRYVKNRPSSQFAAYQALEDLDTLFAYHRDLGLTPGEYKPIQRSWLVDIKPEGITIEELAEAVRPSRYVRGSDVLDIFGD